MLSSVPNKVLGEFRLARGHRIPFKMPHFEKPKTDSYWNRSSGVYSSTIKDEINGNLPFAEYRFFCGVVWKNDHRAHCRACKTWVYFYNETDPAAYRRKHLEDKGCNVTLLAAYKLLLRKRKCVMCGKSCRKSKWGVPLCGDKCQHEWMVVKTQPDALVEALSEVLRDSKGPEGGRRESNNTEQKTQGNRSEFSPFGSYANSSGTLSGEEPYTNWDSFYRGHPWEGD